jgi:hypothetical protein
MDLQTAFDRGFEAVKAYVDGEIGTLVSRLADLETRALDVVPPELAGQLKAAALMLEQPPLFERPVARHLAGVMITRAGELAVSYSDGSSERLGLVIGPAGEPGPPGRDGVAGGQGDVGPRGRDGISVTGAAINRDGELMLTLSDGTVLTPGRVEGRTK